MFGCRGRIRQNAREIAGFMLSSRRHDIAAMRKGFAIFEKSDGIPAGAVGITGMMRELNSA